jgi:hypothetical protein
MKKYTLKENEDGTQFIEMIDEEGIMSFVPIAADNADYQAYLKSIN